MSSPFATFRKNREFWMAALVLLAILAFVVAPAIDMIGNAFRNSGVDNSVVVSWDGGRMTRNEVEIALQKRNHVLNFLRALAKKVIEYGGEPAVPGFSRLASGEVTSLGIDEVLSPDRVCLNRILTTQASRMGIQFDDQAADQFLLSYCDEKIADDEFYDILRTNAGGLTIHDVREQIKQELAFLLARNLASGITSARPPAMTWRDFLKLTQTAKVEAFPVYVHDHVSKVEGLPDESEIQEIFEQGKNRLPNPYSELPGFVRSAKAKAEFVESRFQDWVEKEKPNITEDEIKAEYDRLVSIGQLKVPVTQQTPQTSEESEGKAPETPASEDSESEAGTAEPSAVETSAADTPATDSPVEVTPTAETPAAESPAADTPAEGTPAADKPAAEESPIEESSAEDASGATPNPEDNAGVQDRSSTSLSTTLSHSSGAVHLVAAMHARPQEGSGETQENPPAEGETSNSIEVAGNESSDQVAEITDAPQETPIDSESGDSKSAVVESENAGSDGSDSTGTDEEAGIATTEPSETSEEKQAEPEMRTQTIDEAREQIVEDLAKLKARPKAIEVLTRVQQMMRDYYLAYRQYLAFQEAEVDNAEAPIRPDLKKFAEENGLIYGETELGDSNQLETTSLGQSSVFIENRRAGLAKDLLPLPQVETFAPLMSGLVGDAQNEFREFYFWKVDSQPAVEPQLNDVRDEVIAAWKRKKAWTLAEDAAKELSKKVGDGEDPWASALSETLRPLVITTDPFPWLARMGMGGGSGISTTFVPKLEGVGEDFMKQVFATEVGKVGVAPNQAKSVYYVIRVIEKLPSVEELQKRFESDQIKQGPLAVAQEEQANSEDIWLNRVFSDLNVDFKTNAM